MDVNVNSTVVEVTINQNTVYADVAANSTQAVIVGIPGVTQDLSDYIPYTGWLKDADAGSFGLTVGGLIIRNINGNPSPQTIYNQFNDKIFDILDTGEIAYGGDAISGPFDPSWRMQVNKTLLGGLFANSDDNGRIIFGVGMNGSTSAASFDMRVHGSGYSEYLMGNDVTNAGVLLCNGGSPFYIGNYASADVVFGANNEEVGRYSVTDGSLITGKEANGTYVKQFNASGGTAPEIDFFTDYSRKMVFGYDPVINRGIFYFDETSQGVYFRADGVGIGAIGGDTLAAQVFQVPISGNGIFIDPSGAGSYDGTSALHVNGTSKLPTVLSATRLNIPNGTAIACANAGDLALDTTDNQLLAGGGTPLVLALPKKVVSVTIPGPSASDDKPLFQLPYPITITKVTGTCQGGTSVTFNLQKHTSGGLNSAGTNMLTSSLTATTTGASTTSFAAATVAANECVNFKATGIGGAVTNLVLMIEYIITRT